MDLIQKILVKAGRKDLAQKYYKKVAEVDEYEKYIDDVAKGIDRKIINSKFKKTLGISIKSISEDIQNEKLKNIEKFVRDYYEEGKSVAQAIKGLYDDLMDLYHAQANFHHYHQLNDCLY